MIRVALVVAALAGSQPAAASMVDRVAAVVDDEVIAMSEVYELGGSFIQEQCPEPVQPSCRYEIEMQVLDSLIMRVLMRHELSRLGLDISSEDLDRTIDQIARDNGLDGRDHLRREIEASGLRWDAYREQLREQLRQLRFQEAIIRPRIQVSEDELLDLYRRSARDFSEPPTATIEAIVFPLAASGEDGMVEGIALARTIRQQILDGELTWEAAVEQYHSGKFARPDGTMPPVKQGDLMPALDTVVFAAQEGDITEPVLVAGYVFLVRVDSLQSSGVLPFEEAKPQLREAVYMSKVEAQVDQWYLQARRQTAVRVLIEPPEP